MPELLEQRVQDLSLDPLMLRGDWTVWGSDKEFEHLCARNPQLRLERSAEGDLIIMTPEGGSSGSGNFALLLSIGNWSEHDGTGRAFGSSVGYVLPNRAIRSPDVSWVSFERLAALTDNQWQSFLPVCPEFVVELLSKTDSRRFAQEKMEEYIEQGVLLGWLIDPFKKKVHIYRPGVATLELENPEFLDGESVLPGFRLELQKLWKAVERPRPPQ